MTPPNRVFTVFFCKYGQMSHINYTLGSHFYTNFDFVNIRLFINPSSPTDLDTGPKLGIVLKLRTKEHTVASIHLYSQCMLFKLRYQNFLNNKVWQKKGCRFLIPDSVLFKRFHLIFSLVHNNMFGWNYKYWAFQWAWTHRDQGDGTKSVLAKVFQPASLYFRLKRAALVTHVSMAFWTCGISEEWSGTLQRPHWSTYTESPLWGLRGSCGLCRHPTAVLKYWRYH